MCAGASIFFMCESGILAPVGTTAPTLDEDISLPFLYVLLTEKNQNLVDIQNNVFANWETYKVS